MKEPEHFENAWENPETVKMWKNSAANREELMEQAPRRMLEASGIRPGFRVLDIATGTRDQSLARSTDRGTRRIRARYGHFRPHA